MILTMLAIFDSKAEVYSRPFYAVSIGSALRSFEDAVNDGKSEYAMHPGDYTVFQIGQYDDVSGVVKMNEKGHVNLGNGMQFVKGGSDPAQLRLAGA